MLTISSTNVFQINICSECTQKRSLKPKNKDPNRESYENDSTLAEEWIRHCNFFFIPQQIINVQVGGKPGGLA